MKTSKKHTILFSLMIFIIICSCNKDNTSETGNPGSPIITGSGEPFGQPDQITIGPEGGTINSSDGLLSVNIPQGALLSSTVISIQPVTNQAPLGLGNGYRLGPKD